MGVAEGNMIVLHITGPQSVKLPWNLPGTISLVKYYTETATSFVSKIHIHFNKQGGRELVRRVIHFCSTSTTSL